jgi:hypothetical protein
MAAIQKPMNGSVAAPSRNEPASASLPASPSRSRALIANLAELHDEAAETALLANLLGRVPYLAVVLLILTLAAAMLVHGAFAPLLTWVTLMGAGLIALTRAYVTMIAAPFERARLRFFARDLQATMLYVGFAWGAGSFLALPADVSFLQLLAFGAGAAVLVAAIARASDAVACFVIPATVLPAAASLGRPLEGGVFACAAILAAGLAIMGIAYFSKPALLRPQDARFATNASG